MKTRLLQCAGLVPLAAAVLLAGCETLDQVSKLGTSAAVMTGTISSQQAESINRSASAVGKTFDSITPEQEYYIGRTVGAVILHTYKAWDDPIANYYLNAIGQSVALASDRPETFGGYHFQILDTDEINAFAAPGGLIFVSRGMLRCCKSEDAVAAVLAHEIGHVAGKHGLQAIEKGRLSSAFTILATEAGKNLAGQQLADLTKAFEGTISDITTTMINNGYSRSLESQADKAAVRTLENIGYDPHALVDMLKEMEKHLKPGGKDFAKTHPSPASRIAEINKEIGAWPRTPAPAARQARFNNAMRNV